MGNTEVARTNFLVVVYRNFESYTEVKNVLEETAGLNYKIY